MVERDDDRRGPDPHDDDPDAPASAEEIAASERLRDALAGEGADADEAARPEIDLALSLRAAWAPDALSVDESRAVLDVLPTVEEQQEALALREALAEGREPRTTDHADVYFARALRAAFAPSSLKSEEHRRIVDAALAAMPTVKARRGVVVRVAFGTVAAGLALAASILVVITSAPTHRSEAPLAKARTTQPLFSEPFRAGEASARIDRIATARATDFRDNRFTKWGVR